MSADQDFSPESRASAWWATDTRRAVSGQLIDVLREKRGEIERPDLSGIEAVRMGLTLQPAIAEIFTETTGIHTRPLEIAGTHKSEPWLRAHFDFLAEDGGLVEVKNFNGAVINKYSEQDEEPVRIPPADYWQCLHEAVVYDAPHVYFCVLFGGQRFRYWKLSFDQAERDQLLQDTAKWWALYQSGDMPTPETVDQARIVYTVSNPNRLMVADEICERMIEQLKDVSQAISKLETLEQELKLRIMTKMHERSEIVGVDGSTLVSWKTSNPSKKFDAKALEAEMPEIYKMFLKETPGTRRFLVK